MGPSGLLGGLAWMSIWAALQTLPRQCTLNNCPKRVNTMQIININSNITAFYFGAEAVPEQDYANSVVENDWVVGACFSLGVASYAIHNASACIVFDTLCSPEQASLIKTHLENTLGITKFTVVLSHWHLHHIGGNALYKHYNIVATRKTREILLQYKPQIEAGTSSWGPPAIASVCLPNLVFDHNLSIYLDNLEVQLHSFHIHSQDSLCAYIPKFKMLLAGDMVEDTAPFITNPEAVPTHIQNYDHLRNLDIAKILPNHCRFQALQNGGYCPSLIESSCYYLKNIYNRLKNNPDASIPDLRTFLREFLDAGQIHYWPPYERIHNSNIEKMRNYFKSL